MCANIVLLNRIYQIIERQTVIVGGNGRYTTVEGRVMIRGLVSRFDSHCGEIRIESIVSTAYHDEFRLSVCKYCLQENPLEDNFFN
jgi:hypothetical protein